MMRGALVSALVLLVSVSASAQQPPEDARLSAYRQLLVQANETIALLMAQNQTIQTENAALKTKLKELESHAAPKE